MKKLILSNIIFLILVCGSAYAQPVKFLEEKTAFCYSEKSLAEYLQFASVRDFKSLNKLVLKGKCDFVPDGEVIRLKNYRMSSIGEMKVVEFEMNNHNYWTFNALVQSASFK